MAARDKKFTQLTSKRVVNVLAAEEHTDQDRSNKKRVAVVADKKDKVASAPVALPNLPNPKLANRDMTELLRGLAVARTKKSATLVKIFEAEIGARKLALRKSELEAAAVEKSMNGEASEREEEEIAAIEKQQQLTA